MLKGPQLKPRPHARHIHAAAKVWDHHPAADVGSHNGARVGALVGWVCTEELRAMAQSLLLEVGDPRRGNVGGLLGIDET